MPDTYVLDSSPDDVAAELLEAAEAGRHDWVTTPYFLTLVCGLEQR